MAFEKTDHGQTSTTNNLNRVTRATKDSKAAPVVFLDVTKAFDFYLIAVRHQKSNPIA